MGPSLLAKNEAFRSRLLPPDSKFNFEMVGNFGFMIYAFILGLQFDANSLKTIGKKSVIIGLSGTLFPLVFGSFTFAVLQNDIILYFHEEVLYGLHLMVAINAMTSFIVISSYLTDLNILNSEIGRFATSTSIVSDACGWFMAAIVPNIQSAFQFSGTAPLVSVLVMFTYYSAMIGVFRPLVVRLAINDDEEPMRRGHFIGVVTIILGLAFVADYIGQHWAFGIFIFGVCLPARPPLSSVFAQKFGTLAVGILLPLFCSNGGLRMDLATVRQRSSVPVEALIVMGYLGKFTGTILASLYFKFPFRDASSLALIMCFKGIIEIAAYALWRDIGLINDQVYALLVMTMVIATGLISPILSYIYDPSKRYMEHKRRSINMRHKPTADLRLLVCVHSEENVPTMINLLEATHPTRSSPVTVFVLQLSELNGLTSAILAPLNQCNKPRSKLTRSEQIVNAFKYFERHSQGPVVVQHFTAIAPYASIHNDICNLALDKKSSMIIIPYHKKWGIDGSVEASFSNIEAVNQNVIEKAPCSVGVLIDRGPVGHGWSVFTEQSLYRVAMPFLGGADDRAALEYAKRMAGHPNISLTVVWLMSLGNAREGDEREKFLDSETMYDLRASASLKEKIVYKEETVNDGIGTTQTIRSMEEEFDLFIVGRMHDPKSPMTLGLAEWSESPELGVMGEMLANSDFDFSVLVIQN
ncbi:cation/H(+) antiporter 14-like [Malania oleifera]|uniref:cation/H(+) antiporter 14-like n=1 Tax=Malania oleifera TaxID=397392 RepID=UPI0025AE4F41|nr:cation/H(+) antiporter 14-like [Malania oleifera]